VAADIIALDALFIRLYAGTAFSTGVPWFTNCSSDVKMIDATYYILNGTSIPQVIVHTLQGGAGAGQNQPQEVAQVLTLRTPQRGRRYRGRIYLPGSSTTSMLSTNGTLTATVLANFLVQARGVLGALPPISWKWGVASYGHGTLNGVATSWAPFFTELQDVSMDAVPDVQRRRKQ
jgi:hypothetical protein